MDTIGKVVIICNNHHLINKVDKFSKAAEDTIDSKMSTVFPYAANKNLQNKFLKICLCLYQKLQIQIIKSSKIYSELLSENINKNRIPIEGYMMIMNLVW